MQGCASGASGGTTLCTGPALRDQCSALDATARLCLLLGRYASSAEDEHASLRQLLAQHLPLLGQAVFSMCAFARTPPAMRDFIQATGDHMMRTMNHE